MSSSFQHFNRKLKINIKIEGMAFNLRNRIVYLVSNDEHSLLILLANNIQSKEAKIINQTAQHPSQVVFETQQKIPVNHSLILAKIEVKCQEEGSRVIMAIHDYQNIAQQIEVIRSNEDNEEIQEEIQDSEGEEDEEEEEQDQSNQMEDQEQSGGNNQNQHRNYHTIQKYNEDSSNNNNNQHRGRGRPKGSKNKKTIIKEALQQKEAPPIELKMSLSGPTKRGKGRPKGSKNKVKDFSHPVKIQQGSQTIPFGKRGKGRPKGSKNKIKLSSQVMIEKQSENLLTKRKGRPPGAKNRVNSVQSLSGDHQISQEFIKTELIRPQFDVSEKQECCVRCQQNTLKRKIFESETNVQQNIDSLKNVFEDLGLQNKSNLIITAIRLGDWESLQQLLSIVNNIVQYYGAPWNVQKTIERNRFEIKTKKEHLSKTGKEGNNVLLHDCFKRKEIWWKQISVERIIQNLPREQPQVEHILELIFKDSDLKNQIYLNVVSVIRSGNFIVAEMLLRDILYNPNKNKLNFSQQHYQLLLGNLMIINQFKKFNLIQHNQGLNYCSPIHAAAISDNSQFLRKLLQVFTDIINVQDSIGRKPIHYASLSNNSQNLSILVESGADLKQLDRRRMTALMLACYEGMYYNVEYILQKIRDQNYINFKSQEGFTALHYAILSNNIECIELLINDPYVDLWALTKDKADLFHLLAGTGNTQIMDLILKKQILPYTSHDKFKKTPPMIAIRNNNNDCFVKLIQNGCKLDKVDSSLNTLLHYAAAYGNIQAILILKGRQAQTKNKRGLYPWEIAIYKGHLGAAKLLQSDEPLDFSQDPLYFALQNIRGTPEFMECIRYIKDKMMSDIYFQQKNSGNGYLHLICQTNQEEYLKKRREQTYLSDERIKEEFNWVQSQLLDLFVEQGLDGYQENYNEQTPLKLCIENNNLIGIQRLLKGKITFEPQPSSGNTILHCLGNLGCKGLQELNFVQKKLKQCNVNELKINLKKIDHAGFDFMLYFVKSFTENAAKNFRKILKKYTIAFQEHKLNKSEQKYKIKVNCQADIQKKALDEFFKFQEKFLNVVEFLVDLGCDINAMVVDRRNELSQKYRRWGIQHFIMRFPSLKIVKFFKTKIRDFNAPNIELMTPLHLFTNYIAKGYLIDTKLKISNDYLAENILEYLLSNGLNPNCYDSNKALPLLQAARNSQYEFMQILRKHKSEVNFCTLKNMVPFIEIVKNTKKFNIQQIQSLLTLGFDPNFADNDKRIPLHHLVFHSANLDGSPEVCRLLLEFGCKINTLDKYQRSPIFYCFSDMEDHVSNTAPLQKVQIVQVLINHKDINLNLVDVYKRTILHYACQKNHFLSIMYLLDKNINIEAKDHQQNTPLALCLKTRNLDQAALLISKGVRYGFVNDKQQKMSYFGYAFNNLSAGICFMLLDHGYPIQKALQQIPSSCFKESLIQKYILR